MNDQLETLKHVKRIIIDLPIQFGPKVLIAIAIIAGVTLVGTKLNGLFAYVSVKVTAP